MEDLWLTKSGCRGPSQFARSLTLVVCPSVSDLGVRKIFMLYINGGKINILVHKLRPRFNKKRILSSPRGITADTKTLIFPTILCGYSSCVVQVFQTVVLLSLWSAAETKQDGDCTPSERLHATTIILLYHT